MSRNAVRRLVQTINSEVKMSVNSESIHAWIKLRNAISKLDYMIPEDAFQDKDEGRELADSVSNVWDALYELQRYYGQFHMVRKDSTTDED